MPDYIMRWLASRFLDEEIQEELGILTPAVRARKTAQDTAMSLNGDTAGPSNPSASAAAPAAPAHGAAQPAASALTDSPPVIPAKISKGNFGLDLGPACEQCGGMMQRTGSCYTCSSCGNNTGCG
jgi:ribonucleoside-diphosphate reductase alpha chain